MTGVHHVVTGDADRDPLLHVVLGAQAWIARLDALLERHAPPEPDAKQPAGPVRDDIAIVLGVLAVRARIVRELDAIVALPEAGATTASPRPGWLR